MSYYDILELQHRNETFTIGDAHLYVRENLNLYDVYISRLNSTWSPINTPDRVEMTRDNKVFAAYIPYPHRIQIISHSESLTASVYLTSYSDISECTELYISTEVEGIFSCTKQPNIKIDTVYVRTPNATLRADERVCLFHPTPFWSWELLYQNHGSPDILNHYGHTLPRPDANLTLFTSAWLASSNRYDHITTMGSAKGDGYVVKIGTYYPPDPSVYQSHTCQISTKEERNTCVPGQITPRPTQAPIPTISPYRPTITPRPTRTPRPTATRTPEKTSYQPYYPTVDPPTYSPTEEPTKEPFPDALVFVIAGAVAGAIGFLTTLVCCTICCCRKKKYEAVVSDDSIVDYIPPVIENGAPPQYPMPYAYPAAPIMILSV